MQPRAELRGGCGRIGLKAFFFSARSLQSCVAWQFCWFTRYDCWWILGRRISSIYDDHGDDDQERGDDGNNKKATVWSDHPGDFSLLCIEGLGSAMEGIYSKKNWKLPVSSTSLAKGKPLLFMIMPAHSGGLWREEEYRAQKKGTFKCASKYGHVELVYSNTIVMLEMTATA